MVVIQLDEWLRVPSDQRLFTCESMVFLVMEEVKAPMPNHRTTDIAEELRKTRRMLAEIQRIARIGNWQWDIQTGRTTWSEELYRLFGLDPQESSCELPRALIHPEDRTLWEEALQQALWNDRPFEIDYRALRPDGTLIWIHNEAEVIRDAAGKPVQMWGTAQDITRRKLAEDELHRKKTQHEALFKSLPYGTIVWRRNAAGFELIDFNEAAFALSKGKVEQMLGRRPQEIYPDHPQILESIETCFATHTQVRRQIHYRTLGDDSWAHVIFHFAFCPPDLVMMEGENITARIQAEASARESQDKYSRLFNLISDPVFLIDKVSGEILEINMAAEQLYGYSRRELLGLRNADISAEPEETAQAALCQLPAIPLRRHRKKDGTIFPVEITTSHLNWQGRNVQLEVVRDITFRIEASRQRAELEDRLRQAQKMEAIGTLAGGIAHDFNNILASVVGYTELAMDDVNRGGPVYENLEEVLVAASRAKELVQQILTFSRQSEQQMQPTQVERIVKEAARLLRSTLPSTIALQIDICTAQSTIFGDATQIHQVIMNLCTNALHAMEDYGGTLGIRLENVDIGTEGLHLFGDLAPGPYLLMRISDTGTGIAPEIIDRIFEPYLTTKAKGKGTGLGLAVVHGIVQAHRGSIAVKSRQREGTTIDVFFPLIQKSEIRPPILSPDLPRGSEHLLLVDDEVQIALMQKQVLEKLGYSVSAHTSSLDALEAFMRAPDQFQAVITDMTMPFLTGDRLAQQIKTIRPHIPIILWTGYSEKLQQKETWNSSVNQVLMKPVGKYDLSAALRSLLDLKQAG